MKRTLNYELLEFHIREAAGELDSLLRRIRFMLGKADENDILETDAWGALTETGLEVSLAHAYHHMNTAHTQKDILHRRRLVLRRHGPWPMPTDAAVIMLDGQRYAEYGFLKHVDYREE